MSADDPYGGFRLGLLDAGLLLPTGVEGLYGRSRRYQDVVDALDRLIVALGAGEGYEEARFPPFLARQTFERTDYLRSFPQLAGAVHVFGGNDRQHAELLRHLETDGDWPSLLEPSDVVLCSAACHPVYPLCTGRLAPGGRRFEVQGFCFRHEPSPDPARMQAFEQHEQVYLGDPEDAVKHRDRGVERGADVLASLGLAVEVVAANDPFFGRLGQLLATNQRDATLKLEVVTPICRVDAPTAILSGNCHLDHFGAPFGIETADGATAHSACVGWGMDRITLALLHTHGLDVSAWPADVRARLWP